jgi:hypothetical protein
MPGGGVAAFAFAEGVEPVEASGLLSDLHEVKREEMAKIKRSGSGRFIKFICEA